jgi:hypothetical protein
MNTDKERKKIGTNENNSQEQIGLWELNSVDPGSMVPTSLVFSSSVFISVHLWFQTADPCA